MKKLKALVEKAAAPTLVVTAVFFLTYYFFGMENTMIAPFVTLSFLRLRRMCNHYECMVKNYIVYMIMAVLAFLAVINIPLCIIVNAAALFWLTYLLIDEYNPTNYFPAGMALIFFQIAHVYTLHGLGMRIAALGATFGIVFILIFLLSRRHRKADKERLSNLIRQGFENCRMLLDACEDQDHEMQTRLHHQLCEINEKCSEEIYSYNRASLRLKGKTNWYCRFVLIFQILNYQTTYPQKNRNLQKAQNLYQNFYQLFTSYQPSSDYKRLNFRNRRQDIRNFRLRFSLRQVIVVTPCMLFAYASGLANAYWLVISVFFMMIPFSEDTMPRVRQRITGTIIGIIACFFLFSIFQEFPQRVILMTIANFMIYAANSYGSMVVYITCSALALQSLNTSIPLILSQRLIYTLAGAGITIIANRLIFPIRVRKQIDYLIDLLRVIRAELTEVAESTVLDEEERHHQIDQLIVKSYLLSKRLENLHATLPKEEQSNDFEVLRRKHMNFLAEYLSHYMIS